MSRDYDHQQELEAAESAVDPERLLDGEDPDSRHVEDAVHWIAVYSELLLFKERLIDTAQQGMLGLTEFSARKEAANSDIVLLTAERERLVRRLGFWKRREKELRQGGR